VNVHRRSFRDTPLPVLAATLVIVIWGINQAQSVVVLLLVSVFLAVLGMVPVLWMVRHHIPSVVAVLAVMAAMVAFLLSIGAVVGASLNGFASELPSYQSRMHDILMSVKAMLRARGIPVTDKVLFDYFNPGLIMNFTATLFAALGSVLSDMLLIVFTMMFILLEASGFPAKLRLIRDYPRASLERVTKFAGDIKRYMVIKTLINLLAATLITIWLIVLGVDFPILWGFLAFLLHYIPGIGSMMAAVPALLLALVESGPGTAALTAAGYLVIGTMVGNMLEPKLMGRRFGMSPLVVFVSLILWGSLLGLAGALLCVPLTMTLKLACEQSEQTRWIAVLLGPETSLLDAPIALEKPA
jgi:predicted PurR-regulated permease PerM